MSQFYDMGRLKFNLGRVFRVCLLELRVYSFFNKYYLVFYFDVFYEIESLYLSSIVLYLVISIYIIYFKILVQKLKYWFLFIMVYNQYICIFYLC